MSLLNTKVKKQFIILKNERLSKYFWALAIDSIDIIPSIINSILTLVGGSGIATDLGLDAIQLIGAFAVFEDPTFIVTNVDFILPAPFDIFPAYTSKLIIHDIFGGKK